jgi:hypothetical protein
MKHHRRKIISIAATAVIGATAALLSVALPGTASAATGFPALATLDGWGLPSLIASRTPNVYPKGSTVNVVCQDTGVTLYGTNIWDKTAEGYWVNDRYVDTDTSGFASGVPRCSATAFTTHTFPVTATLDGRYRPTSTSDKVVNKYANGSTITVSCQTTGDTMYGSTIWDKTSDGLYVPDYYVKTGYSGFAPGVPRCPSTSSPQPFIGVPFKVTATLDGRWTPTSTSYDPLLVDRYPNGSTITVICQIAGDTMYGSNIWDKVADGYYVPDYYVRTGYSGFAPGVPRCAYDTIPNGLGTPFTATATLDGRLAPMAMSPRDVDKYPRGSTIYVKCQTTGETMYGSNIWDKTSDDLYVPDYYVDTNASGFAPGVPRCQSTDIETPPATETGTEAAIRQAIVDRTLTALTTPQPYRLERTGTTYYSKPGWPDANTNYLGKGESNKNWNAYDNYACGETCSQGPAWCGFFAAAMWNKQAIPKGYTWAANWVLQMGSRSHPWSASDVPKLGDAMAWGSSAGGHVEIVVAVSGTTVTTIGGNTGYNIDSITRHIWNWSAKPTVSAYGGGTIPLLGYGSRF